MIETRNAKTSPSASVTFFCLLITTKTDNCMLERDWVLGVKWDAIRMASDYMILITVEKVAFFLTCE